MLDYGSGLVTLAIVDVHHDVFAGKVTHGEGDNAIAVDQSVR